MEIEFERRSTKLPQQRSSQTQCRYPKSFTVLPKKLREAENSPMVSIFSETVLPEVLEVCFKNKRTGKGRLPASYDRYIE